MHSKQDQPDFFSGKLRIRIRWGLAQTQSAKTAS
jgi:hypothetical protein